MTIGHKLDMTADSAPLPGAGRSREGLEPGDPPAAMVTAGAGPPETGAHSATRPAASAPSHSGRSHPQRRSLKLQSGQDFLQGPPHSDTGMSGAVPQGQALTDAQNVARA